MYICGCYPSACGFGIWGGTGDPTRNTYNVCIDDVVTFSAWPFTWDGDGCPFIYFWTRGGDAYDIHMEEDNGWGYWRYSSVGDRTVTLTVIRVTSSDPNSCCITPRTANFSRTVTVVKVASLLPDVGEEFDDGDGNPDTKSFAVCVADSGVVTVTATPNPTVQEQYLPGQPYTWGWQLTGGTGSSWLFRTVDRTTPGVTTISCTCGSSSKTTKIYVVKVEIIEPDENLVTDNNFTFNAAMPGVCNVPATGTTGVSDIDKDLQWSISGIPGSTLTSNPPDRKGPTITFTYTTLPSSWVGWKNLYLTHPAVSCMDWQLVEIFFLRDEYNNPGGTNPNWYYYWSQTSASSGNHQYDGSKTSLFGYYSSGDTHFYICPLACGYNNITGDDGIDTFAETCFHEKAHMDYFLSTWGTWANYLSKQPTEDKDWDKLKDSDEPGMGYDPNQTGTPTNQYRKDNDFEDYASKAEFNWTKGSADYADWANPGHRSNK